MMESQFLEKRVTLLLTDMVGFAQKTVGMTPRQVSDFLIQYRSGLESLIMDNGQGAQHIEHVAGDATASVFETKGAERNEERSKRAFAVALKLLYEMASDRIPPTRIGLYSGRLIETRYNDQILRAYP